MPVSIVPIFLSVIFLGPVPNGFAQDNAVLPAVNQILTDEGYGRDDEEYNNSEDGRGDDDPGPLLGKSPVNEQK